MTPLLAMINVGSEAWYIRTYADPDILVYMSPWYICLDVQESQLGNTTLIGLRVYEDLPLLVVQLAGTFLARELWITEYKIQLESDNPSWVLG